MQHLLGGDLKNRLLPPLDDLHVRRAQTFLGARLDREGSEQILTHDALLEFRGLAEHVDERFSVLDNKRRFGSGTAAAKREHLRQPSGSALAR